MILVTLTKDSIRRLSSFCAALISLSPLSCSLSPPTPPCVFRDEQEAYLAGLGTVGMEIYEQVPKLDAVVVPASGQFGLLAGTAAALKHLNSRILVVVSVVMLFTLLTSVSFCHQLIICVVYF